MEASNPRSMKKSLFCLTLLVSLLAPASGDYRETLARQAREWRAVETHYNNMAPSKAYIDPYRTGSNLPSADLLRPLAELFGLEMDEEQPVRRSERSPARAVTMEQSWRWQPPAQDEVLARAREAELRREQEAEEFRSKVEAYRLSQQAWRQKNRDNPFETLQERPASFPQWEPKQRLSWYELRALGLGGRDPYAALMAAKMLVDEEGVARDDARASEMLKLSLDCSLKWVLAAQLSLRSETTAESVERALKGLRYASTLQDASAGQTRALAGLRKLYANPNLHGFTPPLDFAYRAAALADSQDKWDLDALWLLVMQHRSLLDTLEPGQARAVARRLAPQIDQLTAEPCLALGKLLQQQRDPLCKQYFLGVLPFLDQADQVRWVGPAAARLLALRLADKGLQSLPAAARLEALAYDWARQLDPLTVEDLPCHQAAFCVLSGLAGHPPQPKKALEQARLMAVLGDPGGLLRIGSVCRSGGAGWERNEAMAIEAFRSYVKLSKPKGNQPREYADKIIKVACVFDSPPNHAERARYYKLASELDPARSMLYARFLVEATPFQNRAEAERLGEIAETRAKESIAFFREHDPECVPYASLVLQDVQKWQKSQGF